MHLCTICEIIFLVGGPWKANVALEKSLENSYDFLYEPCHSLKVFYFLFYHHRYFLRVSELIKYVC